MLIGVDDGPGSPEAAVDLAQAQIAAGITKVAATPHVGFSWPLTAAELPAALAELRTLLAEREIGLEVVAGAEIEALYASQLGDDKIRRSKSISLITRSPPFLNLLTTMSTTLGISDIFKLLITPSNIIVLHSESSAIYLNIDTSPKLLKFSSFIDLFPIYTFIRFPLIIDRL